MGCLKLASGVAGWWPMTSSLCAFRRVARIGSLSRPPFVLVPGDRKPEVVNPSSAVLKSNSWTACSERFTRHEERSYTVFALIRSDNAAQSSSVRRTDVAASCFTSSASSVSSYTFKPEDVLQFWFKDVDPPNNVYASEKWFFGGPDFDKEGVTDAPFFTVLHTALIQAFPREEKEIKDVETKFGECLKLAADGALDGWKNSVRGRLALVIVFDQFSRNIYRKSPLAYAYDEKARKITLETIAQGLDNELAAVERLFLYLPLMHSENLEDHDIAVSVFKGLAAEYSDSEHLHKVLLYSLAFEERHKAVLEQFGRYPSRNEDLGRQNTPEEVEHLSKGPAW